MSFRWVFNFIFIIWEQNFMPIVLQFLIRTSGSLAWIYLWNYNRWSYPVWLINVINKTLPYLFCCASIFHTKVRLFWPLPLFIFVLMFNCIIFSLAECSLPSCSVELEVYWQSPVLSSVFTSISFVYSTFYAQGRVSYGHSNITKFPCQIWPPIKDINILWSQFCMETASKNIQGYLACERRRISGCRFSSRLRLQAKGHPPNG